ncbi:PEP-CTERM sorting domain-containing protein [Yoonia sp. SS1-5]|uniref:PEP-CTERM sorting domain-containing protein n=1 Tax=Yoonia rhodophyticola TaxID=3137370 RepID=A0ABZ3JCC0_9RHOB
MTVPEPSSSALLVTTLVKVGLAAISCRLKT